MPTALSLQIVMKDLGTTDNKALGKLTGLSDAQIERCKKLLKFPEKFQEMSLDLNPKTRIPSNFWIEALPVLDLAMQTSEQLKKLGRDRSTEKLVDKYREKRINLKTALAGGVGEPASASDDLATKELAKRGAENQLPSRPLRQLLRSRLDSLEKPAHLRQDFRDLRSLRMRARNLHRGLISMTGLPGDAV